MVKFDTPFQAILVIGIIVFIGLFSGLMISAWIGGEEERKQAAIKAECMKLTNSDNILSEEYSSCLARKGYQFVVE